VLWLGAGSGWPAVGCDGSSPPPDPTAGLFEPRPASRASILGHLAVAVDELRDGLPAPVSMTMAGGVVELRMQTNRRADVDAWADRHGFTAEQRPAVSTPSGVVHIYRGSTAHSPWVGWGFTVFCLLDVTARAGRGDSDVPPAQPSGGHLAAVLVPTRPTTGAQLLAGAATVVDRLGWTGVDGGVSLHEAMRIVLVGDPTLGSLAEADRRLRAAAVYVLGRLLLTEHLNAWERAAGQARVVAALRAAAAVAEQVDRGQPGDDHEQLFAAARVQLGQVS
jgi:hypothetical protein